MSFKDVIKSSVLEGFSSDITTTKIVITLVFSAIIGILIYFVYKYKTKSSFYSKDFNIVLVGLPVITAAIVLAMQSNIVISLGMVGALSIVRFRNAVKSSMDLLFLFWSISIGIICGAGIYELALILSFVIAILLILSDYVPLKKQSLLLIINGSDINIEENLIPKLEKLTSFYKIKSRSIHNNHVDMIIEIKSKKDFKIVKECSEIENVENVSLLSHDGEERL